MSRLFGRGPDGVTDTDTDADPGDFDDVSLALARAYCFAMDSGLGAARDAMAQKRGDTSDVEDT